MSFYIRHDINNETQRQINKGDTGKYENIAFHINLKVSKGKFSAAKLDFVVT
jgi:hypothetical protein